MKKFLMVFAMGMGLGTSHLQAAGSFEGEVDFHVTTNKSSQSAYIIYLIKNNKIRLDTSDGGAQRSLIENLTTRQLTLLMPTQKLYVVIEPPSGKGTSSEEGQMTNTGKVEMIQGKACEEWQYDTKAKQVHLWATSGMGNFMSMGSTPGDADDPWVKVLKEKGLFPLKLILTDTASKTETTMEATKIQKKHLKSSLFTAPKDFRQVDAASLGAAMQQQRKPQ